MSGSALIFVLIIAIWAAFLAQSFSRSHQHAAAARNAERFSTALRVLERRGPLPSPAPEALLGPVGHTSTTESTVNSSPVTSRPARPTVPGPAGHRVAAARVRGILLLTLVAVTVALTVASAVLALTWVAPMVAALLAVAVLGWGVVDARQHRAKVAAERAARRAPRPARSATARPAPAPARPVPAPVAEPVETVEAPAEAAPAPAPVRRRPRGELFDIEAGTPRREAPEGATAVTTVEPTGATAVETSVDGAAPAGRPAEPETTQPEVASSAAEAWEPVPVPRPTYTMKARAARREVPVEELPFDGRAMLLDVEDEELPAVYKVV